MRLKKFLPFLLGGALVVVAATPIVGVVVSCSSTSSQGSSSSSTSSSSTITKSDVEKIRDKLVFDESKIKDVLPSYIKTLFVKSNLQEPLLNNIFDVSSWQADNLGDTYESLELIPSSNDNDYVASDSKGSFSLKIKCKATLKDKSTIETEYKQFSSTKFKKMSDTNVPTQEALKNKKLVVTLNPSGELYKKIDSDSNIKTEINKFLEDARPGDNLGSNDTKEKIKKQVTDWFSNGVIYKNGKVVDKLEIMKNFYGFHLLNSPKEVEFGQFKAKVTDGVKFDYETGLFNFDGQKTIFLIDSISIDTQNINVEGFSFIGSDLRLIVKTTLKVTFNGQTLTQPIQFNAIWDF